MLQNTLSPIRRRVAGATIALGLAVSGMLVAPLSAQAATSVSIPAAVAQILADTNALRAAGGLAPLVEVTAIDAVAQNWSAQMYANGSLTHNPSYSTQIPAGWSGAAENIAVGYTASTVVEGWHQSAGHYANIMGNYNAVGIGYYELNGVRYFTQDFGKYTTLPSSASLAPATAAATSFVLATYTDVLGRTPSTSDVGVQWWVAHIAANIPRTAIAAGFTGSDEYRTKMIVSAYESVLDRAPEPAGQAWWLAQMQAGNAQPDDAHRIFLTTDEFYDVEGGGAASSYVSALYQDILGRAPEAGGVDFWSRVLAQSGRDSVVNGIWNSDEIARKRVSQAYTDLLGRTASTSDLNFWVAVVLRSGTTSMRTQILASQEYWNRAAVRFPQPIAVTTAATVAPVAPVTPSAGFPSASSTGVPAGTGLSAYAGPCTVTVAGTVIDAKTINCARLEIRAKNVTISRSLLNGTVYADPDLGIGSFTISDSQVNVGAQAGTGIGDGNFTALRVHVTGGNRSINCSLNCTVQASYVHGQFTDHTGVYHESGIRIGSGSVLRGNTVACDAPDIAPDAGCSAAITGYGDFAIVQNNTIDGNLIIAGSGGYCTYGGSTTGKPYSSGTNNIRYTNNVYQRGTTGKCGSYGPITSFDTTAPGNIWSNNTWDNGTPVPASN